MRMNKRANELSPLALAWGIGLGVVLALGSVRAWAGPADKLVRLRPVPSTQMRIADTFWQPRIEANRQVSLPINLQMLEDYGNLGDFELAAAGATNGFQGPPWMDSDVYKALEAASYSLATHPDRDLSARLDGIIDKIGAAQRPDGYLDTYFQVTGLDQRWTNLRDRHELYCAGHLFEAAVAHYQSTGKTNFLEVAIRLANHLDQTFGDTPGKRSGYGGHPEVELALIKLWQATGDQRYFELARFFTENRGQQFFAEEHGQSAEEYDGTYWQDDVPICEHDKIKGHAVRAAYLLSGATDVAGITGDPEMLRMIQRVWANTTQRNMYVTGGIGPSAHNEGFTVDYDLPNDSAYQETCASVALAMWAHRMALLYGDAQYADVMERVLYNGVLAGVSLDGSRFFYVNPLESAGHHHRASWFSCACCPPNVARTLAALGGYAYAQSDDALYVNLYIQGQVTAELADGPLALRVTTDYPWKGKVVLEPGLTQSRRFGLRLRVPDWCGQALVRVNRDAIPAPMVEKGYVVLDRTWLPNDRVEICFPLSVRRMMANPKVEADAGQVALQRGPLVYCLESVDQTEPLDTLYLTGNHPFETRWQEDLLGGVVAIEGEAYVTEPTEWHGQLYQPMPPSRATRFRAVPYFAWDNRAAGAMKVWMPTAPPP